MLVVFVGFSAVSRPFGGAGERASQPLQRTSQEPYEFRGVSVCQQTIRGGRFKGPINMCFKTTRTPGTPQIGRKWGPRALPDAVGLSWEIIGFRNRGGGRVGCPQGVQVNTLILNVKCFPKSMPKCGGRSPPYFEMAFGAPGAAQTPKICDFRPAQKPCIKNPSVKGFCIKCMLPLQAY
jgi:hypothetical protein